MKGEVRLVYFFKIEVVSDFIPGRKEGSRGGMIIGGVIGVDDKVKVPHHKGVYVIGEREKRAQLANLRTDVGGARGGEVEIYDLEG